MRAYTVRSACSPSSRFKFCRRTAGAAGGHQRGVCRHRRAHSQSTPRQGGLRLEHVIVSLLFLVAMAGHSAIAQTPGGSVLVGHHFTESAQGWQVAGDTGTVEPLFIPSGGHPDGYITGVDEAIGETWYFRAPAAVLRSRASSARLAAR